MTLRKVVRVGEAFQQFVEEIEQQRRPWMFTQIVEKGGPGSGHWGHAGRPGKRGGSLPGKTALSIRTGRTARRRKAAAKLMGKAKKVGRYKWEFASGMTVETYPVGSEQFKPEGWIHSRILGKIRLPGERARFPGGEITIQATRRYEEHRHKEITAKERDAFLERVVLPTLAEIPPGHLENLNRIEFDAVTGRDVPSGEYHARTEAWSRIEINSWHKFREHDNWEGQQGSLKHEIAHHVWDQKLTDAERVSYARRLGITAGPKALTFTKANYDKEAILKVMGTELKGSVTPYGRTNVFEDFAEWYKGWNEPKGAIDRHRVAEAYWDQSVEFDITSKRRKAFQERRTWLPNDLFER